MPLNSKNRLKGCFFRGFVSGRFEESFVMGVRIYRRMNGRSRKGGELVQVQYSHVIKEFVQKVFHPDNFSAFCPDKRNETHKKTR